MKDNFVFKFENYIQKENKSSLIIALDNCNTERVLYYFNSCDTLIMNLPILVFQHESG